MLQPIIKNNLDKISFVCKKYKVKEMYAFGSVTRKDFKKKSDVDLLVEFKKLPILEYADNYLGFEESLMKLFSRKVDLVSPKYLRNRFFIKEVNDTKQKIYPV